MARMECIGGETYINVDHIEYVEKNGDGRYTITMDDSKCFIIENTVLNHILGKYSIKSLIPVQGYNVLIAGNNKINTLPLEYLALTEDNLVHPVDVGDAVPGFYDLDRNFYDVTKNGKSLGWCNK